MIDQICISALTLTVQHEIGATCEDAILDAVLRTPSHLHLTKSFNP